MFQGTTDEPVRVAGEDTLRELAAIRDEAELALYAIFWSIPVPARLNYIARGEKLPPLPVVPTVTSGGTVPPGDATIAPYGATAGQEG